MRIFGQREAFIVLLQVSSVCVASIAGQAAAQQISVEPLKIVNSRPVDEDHQKTLSLSTFSCSYYIRVLNDEGRAKNRMDVLSDVLKSKLGSRGNGHRIEVLSYQIYFNEAAAATKDAWSAGVGGALGSMVAGSVRLAPKCSQDKTPYGWFDPKETTNTNPPLVIQMTGKIDEKPFEIRSVYSPAVKLSTTAALMPSKAKRNLSDVQALPEVEAAMNKALGEIVLLFPESK